MKIKILYILTLLFLQIYAFAQHSRNQLLKSAEYFYNSDPGKGNGISIPGTYYIPELIINLTNLDIPKGTTVYIRAYSTDSIWSNPVAYKKKTTYFENSGASLVYAEYFINSDPGKGNGISISLNNGNLLIPNLSLIKNDVVYIRVKDSYERWSNPTRYKQAEVYSLKGDSLIYAEYYINNDPGKGNAIPISIVNNTISINNLILNLNNKVFIRVKDIYNRWSNPFCFKQINFSSAKGAKINYAEYFKKTDPGEGNGVIISIKDSSKVVLSINNYTQGNDSILHIRVRDDYNRWSNPVSINLNDSLYNIPQANFEYAAYSDINSYKYNFINRSRYSNIYYWDFGDNTKSTQDNPEHVYSKTGTYKVKLIAYNKALKDTIIQTIIVNGIERIDKNYGGNTGYVSITAYGGGFKTGTTFLLRKTGVTDIKGDSIKYPRPGEMTVFLNLTNKTTGIYDVVVKVPGELSTWTLKNAFTIQSGTTAQPWVKISGHTNIQKGLWQTYTITYGNKGNIDAYGVPLWIAVSDIGSAGINFSNVQISESKYLINKGYNNLTSNLPLFLYIPVISGENGNFTVYPLYIPKIRAGDCKTIYINIKTVNQAILNIKLRSWVTQPMFRPTIDNSLSKCFYTVLKDMTDEHKIDSAPTLNSIITNTQLIYNPLSDYLYETNNGKQILGSINHNSAGVYLISSNDTSHISLPPNELAGKISSLGYNATDLFGKYYNCMGYANPMSLASMNIKVLPNVTADEKSGPDFITYNHYINNNISLPYTIYFANNKTSADAFNVTISDTLNKNKLDLKTFSFGNITLADSIIRPKSGLTKYTKDIDFRPSKQLILRIFANLDTVKGIARWEFQSLDTTTMSYLKNTARGFFPPNIISPQGEGSVSFTCETNKSITLNDIISNKASKSINYINSSSTNSYFITTDNSKPTSKIKSLPYELHDTTIKLSWNSLENGSGIRGYNIFMIVNDTLKFELLNNTADTTITITHLKLGYNYKFYSIAIDSVYNIESKTEYDTQVLVLCKEIPQATITPQGTQGLCQGNSILLKTNTGSGLTYQWQKNVTNISGATTSSYSTSSAGTYRVIIYKGNYCYSTSATVTVIVNSLPSATLTASGATTFCQGNSVNLNANSGTYYSYLWKKDGSNIIGATQSTLQATAGGIYSVIVTDNNSCSKTSSTVTITVNSLPTATVTPQGQTSFCQGNYLKLTSNTGTGYLYQWKKEDINIVNATNSALNVIASGNYSIQITNTLGCKNNSSPINITVNQPPTANISPQGNISGCLGSPIELQVSNYDPQNDYHWKKDGTNITGATFQTYNATLTGSYTVMVTDKNICSSISSASSVTLNPVPTAVITIQGTTTFCKGGSVILKANTATGQTYQWKLNGQSLTDKTNTNYVASETGLYSVSVTNTYNCSKTSAEINVISNPLPVVNIISSIPDGKIFSDESITLNAGNNFSSYKWSTGAITQSIILNGNVIGTGNHSYIVTVSNSYNCFNSDTIIVSVSIRPKYTISGSISYDNKLLSPITNSILTLKDLNQNTISTVATDIYGNYIFNNIITGIYKIYVTTSKGWSGANPTDALIINKYFVKLYEYPDTLQLKASDVNSDTQVNATDALTINKRYVKMISSFKSGDWLFQSPLINVTDKNIVQNIKGICFGDANASYSPPLKKQLSNIAFYEEGKLNINTNKILIPICATKDIELGAIGLIVSYNSSIISLKDIQPSEKIKNLIYNQSDNKLYIAWSGINNAVKYNSGDTIFFINADIINKNEITKADIHIENGSVAADGNANELEGSLFSIPFLNNTKEELTLSCYPNPFINTTTIEYYLPVDGKVNLKVSNIIGKEIKLLEEQYQDKGNHSILFEGTDVPGGIYIYKLQLSAVNTLYNKTEFMIINH